MSAEAASISASGLERLKLYYGRHEGRVAAAFFAAGFLFDMVTVGRIDSWTTIGQQAIYLTVALIALSQMLLEADQPPLGNWLTKQAIHQVEELRGKRAASDAVFHMHHFAHAQNAIVAGDPIAGLDSKAMVELNRHREKQNRN